MSDYALAAGIIFVAYLVRGIAGFGSGLIAIPLLALLFPLPVVVPAVVMLDLIGSSLQGASNREQISWPDLLPLMPFTLAGIISALYLFATVSTEQLNHSLGVFIVLFAIYQLLPLPDLKGGRILAAPLGFMGGLVGTMFGTGGPFYIIYLNMRQLPKDALRATFAIYFLLDGSIRLTGYFLGLKLLNNQFAMLLAVAIIPFAAGLYCGGQVNKQIPASLFKQMISLLLIASGATLLIR